MSTNNLCVLYNGLVVGYLKQLSDETVSFQYDKDWLKIGFSISPFSLPLENKVFISNSTKLNGVFGVFWDCLPQGWGQRVLQKKLFYQNIDYKKLSVISKLCFSESHARGALRFKPCRYKTESLSDFDLDKLNLISLKAIENQESNKQCDMLCSFCSTSGGAKPKVHLNINNEEWIIKLNIDNPTLGREENKANELAKLCGINVNEFKLFRTKSNNEYFGAKRFDIDKNNKPIHIISLCGLLETTPYIPDLDYSILFQVIRKISIDIENDMYEAYKRMVFNVLYGNKDDHGCNWSFLYDENKKGYKLSPFYDITYTGNTYSEHEMSVLGKGNPNEKDMLEIAKKFNLSITKCKAIIENIKNVLAIN